jgi:hypothetical protein
VIGENVTPIGTGCFDGFRFVAFVEFSEKSRCSLIGNAAFTSCIRLVSINLPVGLRSIGDSAFFYCRELVSINLPANVNTIEARAFGNCNSLVSIKLSSSLSLIGDSAFERCSSLINIKLPSGLGTIKPWAFAICTSLVSIKMFGGITSVGAQAFYDTPVVCVRVVGSFPPAYCAFFAGLEHATWQVDEDEAACWSGGMCWAEPALDSPPESGGTGHAARATTFVEISSGA